jgi:tetratricopeptide (TPR) repeat protein
MCGVVLASCGTTRQAGTPTVAAAVDTVSESPMQRKYNYFFLEAMRQKAQDRQAETFALLQHCLAINPNGAAAIYEMSAYYAGMGDTKKVVACLKRAAELAPDNYWYQLALVNTYLRRDGDVEQAEEILEQMTQRFPDKLQPLYALLDVYNAQGKNHEVIDLLNRLEVKTGKNEQLTMEKFRVYMQMKDNKNALNEIESLVKEYPKDYRYQVVLGDAYMQSKKTKEAYNLYRGVLAEDPDNPLALYSLVSYYDQTGQTERYQQQLDTLLYSRKVDEEVKVNVMRQLITRSEQSDKDSTQIIRLFDRILQQEPETTQLPTMYATYLLSKKMNERAAPVLEQVLQIDPTNAAARLTLLSDAVTKEDYPAIIRLCEAGTEANPDMPEFYFYLAVAYNHDERPDDVLVTCHKALKSVKADTRKEVLSDFYTIMGDAYHSKNMNTETYAAYDSALVYNPDNIGALNNYAYYLSLERKELDKAEEMSYKTVKAEPNNSTYLDTYAWILFEKGNYAEARIYIDNAMTNNTDKSDVIVEHCGDIYFMTGDVEGAVKYWKQAAAMNSKSKTLQKKIEQRKYIPE